MLLRALLLWITLPMTLFATTKVIVIRHGEAQDNAAGMMSSDLTENNSLTNLGKRQALIAARQLEDERIDHIFVSPLKRTRETARIISRHLNISRKNVSIDYRLREPNFGMFENRPYSEFLETLEDLGDEFIKGFPEGESGDEQIARISAFLDEVLADRSMDGKTILIVTHGSPKVQIHRYFTGALRSLPETAELTVYTHEAIQ